MDVINLNMDLLNEWKENLSSEEKDFYDSEGYDSPFDAIITGEFGAYGSISGDEFNGNFHSLEDQRNVLGLYVASLVEYNWSAMGNDWDSKPSYWEGYQIKKDDW